MIYFMNTKDLIATFVAFTVFFFSTSLYTIWMKKIYQNLAKIKGYMTIDLVWSDPV